MPKEPGGRVSHLQSQKLPRVGKWGVGWGWRRSFGEGRKSDTPEGAGGPRGPHLRRASPLVSDRVGVGGEFLSPWTRARE